MCLEIKESFWRNFFGQLCNLSLQLVMNEILDSTVLT